MAVDNKGVVFWFDDPYIALWVLLSTTRGPLCSIQTRAKLPNHQTSHLYQDSHKCEPERLSAPAMSENFNLDGIHYTITPAFPLVNARKPNWEYTVPPPKTPEILRVFPEAAWTSDVTCFTIPWSFFKIFCKDCGINLQSGIGPMKFPEVLKMVQKVKKGTKGTKEKKSQKRFFFHQKFSTINIAERKHIPKL
jgi:hypothetical protein